MKIFFTAALTMLLFSCEKSQLADKSLIADLGIKAIPGGTPKRPAVSFSTKEQAREFLAAYKPRTYSGNIHNKPKCIYDSRIYSLLPSTSGRPLPVEAPTAPVDGGGAGAGGSASLNDWWLWTGYNVTFTWESGYVSISNFSSGLIGFNPGVSWTHQNGSAYYSNGIISYTVHGLQNYNIIVEGVGTLFTQPVTITGTYNTQTGAYTMTEY